MGDKVKTYKKKELARKTERFSVFSQNTYEIEEINEQMGLDIYKLKGLPKKYLRHE